MARYQFLNFSTVELGATGDTYVFVGQLGAGGVLDGTGLFVPRIPAQPTWDQAGWMWLFVVADNSSQSFMVEQKPVFFGFNCLMFYPEAFRTSIGFIRFVPVPWVQTYDLYRFSVERVP